MPRKKQNSEVEQNQEEPDNETLEWSDDESSSDTPMSHDSGMEALKLLAQYGFEIKGELEGGKIKFLFRSPAKAATEAGPDGSNASAITPTGEVTDAKLRALTAREHTGPPPYQDDLKIEPRHKTTRRHNVTKHKNWFLT